MMFDTQSVLVYLGLAVLSFLIAKYAEKANSKKAVWLVIVLFSLVAGLRAITVGIDTKTYDMVFKIVADGTVKPMYGIEGSFIRICSVLLWVWNNSNFLFFVFSFISNALILLRIWQDREYVSFSWSTVCYYIVFFAFSLNGVRQFVAVAMIFYATSYIKQGKYIRFIIATLIAALFHTSALIGLVYILFELIFAKYLDAKRKLTLYLFVAVGGVMGVAGIFSLVNLYSRYFERESSSMGIMMIAKFAMLICSFIFVAIPKDKDERYFCSSHRWNYFIGLLLNSLNYIFLYMGRIGLYFYVFEAIYIGYIFKAKNRSIWTIVYKALYVGILIYYLYDNITSGSQGELPYLFFWQS